MPNARDPFEMDDGFEDIPVVQQPVQAINKVANSAVKQTAQQIKATTKAFISQLYGSSSPTATDDDADAAVDPQAQVQKVQAGQAQHAAASQLGASHTTAAAKVQAANPDDEEKLMRARRELQQTHRGEYYLPTFGDISNLESDIRKEAQIREQREEQEKQQEEEQKQQEEQQIEEKKKQEVPMAVQQARTKSERRPGAG